MRGSYVWQPGNLKLQCCSNLVSNFRFHENLYLYWVYFPSSLPGLGHHRTIGLGYTPLDQRERRPGPLVEAGHLQDMGLSHQQRMGSSDCHDTTQQNMNCRIIPGLFYPTPFALLGFIVIQSPLIGFVVPSMALPCDCSSVGKSAQSNISKLITYITRHW